MTISSGTRLGPYEILAPLGAGGMGEVYRARDKKLDRDVAIKVLPESVAADPDTLARFEREAKAVAALSHPNILAIHDFGTHEGIAYAVMELLEGETLRGKLDRGPITPKQAVDYALQVVKGLSAAHEKGIVHRDLKPENLFVSRDGHVKILDFGLAKRVEAVAPGKETSAPTGSGHTEPGTVMGTAGYMSPEQVKGFPVDHRSDIFAFGAILYELLSGQKAFKRDTNAETIAAILMKEPPELSETGRNISGALDRIVKHCLEKDRERRFQTARDIAFSLSEQSSPAAGASAAKIAPPASQSGFRIAVLPFKCGTADADVLALADGLSEEIVSGLSRFRYLSVVASASADGARYVVEGSIRRGGSDLRVITQLVDVSSGARLWSETYRRNLQASSLFAVQDDIAGRIVATVADSYGVLVHSIRAASGQKDDVDLTAVEWQFQYFAYREQITPASYAALKSRLESAARRNDRQSDLWACLAQVYVDEYAFGFASDATSLDRALAAARRGVELDRANQFALVALAQTHFFRQDLAAFGPAAERAMALNPLNTDAVGILGLQIVHTGEFERGAAIVRRAMELNPNHAGWMHFAPLWEHFHKGEYEGALECANRVDVPGLFWPYLVMASACGHLGRHAEAAAAVRDLLALDPEFAAHARSNVGTWHFASGLMDPILEGLRKAGLSIPESGGSSDAPRRIGTALGPVRSGEGFWVSVLPFKSSGADASLAALADGLTEEIVTGLSRFSYLRVISRTAPAGGRSAANKKEPGARYVMEGSLRQVGSTIRLAVQLVDAGSGAHLWAETFDRPFRPEEILALQDELVPRIVSTVADQHGVLTRSISAAIRKKSDDELGPYEAVFRVFGLHERMTPQEHAGVRAILERVVRDAPDHGESWGMLATLYSDEFMFGFNVRPDPLGRALAAAQRAVEAAPTSPLASQALAQALFFRRERQAFRPLAERTIALNRMDGATMAFMGLLLACSGDWEHGCAVADSAMRLNPHFPGWYRLAAIFNAYRTRDYRAAIDAALRIQMPGYFWTSLACAAAFGQLGEEQPARKALEELLAVRPEFARAAYEELGKWFDPDLVEHFVEGLRKAGLEIAPSAASGPMLAAPSASGSGAVRADEGFWVAVLPFKYGGADASLTALADGLSQEIVTGLSRFSYLRVIARSSSADGQSAGKQLGARYILEGSLRQAGSTLRLAVQLVDAKTGAHLWAENFERTFSPETVFELQDDLVPRIVSTVADMYGVLTRSMSEALRGKADEELSPHEAVLSAFGYMERVTAEEHARVRRILERAVRMAPNQSDAWAMLANLYWEEHAHGLNPQPDPLGRALAAARRAVEAAPSNNLAHYALASTLFFQKDYLAFRSAAERAIELNRMDASVAAFIGNLLAYAGDWERGCAVVESAMQLNPRHPGWYWFASFNDAYRRRDYRGALGFALKINQPGNFYTHAVTAAAYGQLGMRDEARKTLQELLAIRPDFAKTAREELGRWFHDLAFVEHNIDGLRKAGLEIAPEGESAKTESGAARADEGFWVAVLPFKHAGSNPDLKALAEGLSEEVITGLSRFSYLRVIARGSTAKVGARYVMEGTLRQAGTKLRLAVQLVDSTTGAHLWAENYERAFVPEEIFSLQDDLVPRIVSTCGDRFGVLARSISDAVRNTDPVQLSPYEALMRAFGYHQRLTAAEHAEAREALERAVERAQSNADCWAMLSWLYSHEHAHDFNVRPKPLERALAAARRAVDIAPSNPLAQQVLAVVLFFRKETAGCLSAAERAMSLNPLDTSNEAIFLIAFTGDWERGCALIRRAMELNPHHPRWYGVVLGMNEYRMANYRAAVDEIVKANAPDVFWTHAMLAAAHGQLGELPTARSTLRDLLAQKQDFARSAKDLMGKWFEPQMVAHVMEGLRKAGLETPPESATAAPAPDLARSSAADSGASRADEGFWVAVLPFQHSDDAGLAALAEGMTDEIVTGLSRFSYLRVISRTSTRRYSSGAADVRSVGRELGARYVLDGSLRQAGSAIRISVQLIDAVSGANLWAETYNRSYKPEAIFDVQDDVVPRIVSTVADTYGVLPHSMSEALRGKSPDVLTPYEAVIRGLAQLISVSAEEHASVRAALERAVHEAPGNADCWALLSNLCREEYAHGFNLKPDPLGRALAAARRAVEIAPSNHLAYHALATALFLRREFPAFRSAAERAIALNPMDGFTMAYLGSLVAYSGDWDRGCAMAKQARELNPNHPSWYWFSDCFHAYRQGDDRTALDIARKIQMPGFWRANLALAASYGQLGDRESAARALRELLTLRPAFATEARAELQKWWDSDLVERLMDGLRKAGLESSLEKTATSSEIDPVGLPAASGAIRADEGFWIAVLPFKYGGAEASLTALAEGLTEEIVTGLSRFSYLRVIARDAAVRGRSGKELGARYVMEGSIRQAGTRLRLAVQLVDAVSGAHLWAENYERPFSPDAVFELQDDLVPRIVSTVAGMNGVLPRSMGEAVRSRAPQQLSPYEAVLRSFSYFERVTAEELAAARSGLELAVEKAPASADAWAMLALLCVQDYGQGFDLHAESLARGSAAARRAVETAPSSPLAYFSLAQALFFQRDFPGFRHAAERAVALNSMDGNSIAFVGELLTYAGDAERGLALAERAKQLNPHHPGWYWYADFYDAYRRGDDGGALAFALKINLPGHWPSHAAMAAAYGQLGERDAAARAVRDLLKLRPDFAARVRRDVEKWWEPDYVERLIEGWRKAGIDVLAAGGADPEAKSAAVTIAVLPFSDLSPAKDHEYLCEGMAEEIMNALVQVEDIRVASRSSAFRARREAGELAAIARALSVGHVLEGSVRTSGKRLRVTAQLTEVASGYQLWSERYDRDANDVFAVQDEIAAGVVEAVKARLSPGARAIEPRPQVKNLEAYRQYLQGRHFRYTKNDHASALSAYEQAVALDPTHAPSWVGLAEVCILGAFYALIPTAAAYARGKEALATAAKLQGESAEALYVEGFLAFAQRRWEAWEIAQRRAIDLDPSHVQVRGMYGALLSARQRLEEAMPYLQRARELDPLAPFPHAISGLALLTSRKVQESIRCFDEALSFDKENSLALWGAGVANVALEHFGRGIAQLERAATQTRRGSFVLGLLGWALAAAGRTEEARAILAELRSRPAPAPTVSSEAWLLAALGDADGAFELLARAEDERQPYICFTGLPGFDPLRADPRFGALLSRLGLPAQSSGH